MTQPATPRAAEPRVVVDPTELRRLIDQFVALEASDSKAFAEALADNIMEPDPAETAALRSEELAMKSLVAARFLIDNTNVVLRTKQRGTDEHRRTEHFINSVGRERRLLESIVQGLRAQHGILPTAPNPRGRAMRRLVNENMRGDVAKGRFRELVIEETEVDRQRKVREKEERKRARREARAGR